MPARQAPLKGVGEKYFPRVGNYSKPWVLKERAVRATGGWVAS